MSIHGNLAIEFSAAAAWLACAYWAVSYMHTANGLVRWINEHDPGFWTHDVAGPNSNRAQSPHASRSRAPQFEWTMLFARSRHLPKDAIFLDQLGDARWAAGFTLFFWTVAIAATGILSLPTPS